MTIRESCGGWEVHWPTQQRIIQHVPGWVKFVRAGTLQGWYRTELEALQAFAACQEWLESHDRSR